MEFLVGDNVRRVSGQNGPRQQPGYEGTVTELDGRWLRFADGTKGLASRFELVFPEIEEGKFYSTRDGRKVGPMYLTHSCLADHYWRAPQLEDENYGSRWYQTGEFYKRGEEDFSSRSFAMDLVAEWVEPVPEFRIEDGKFYKTRDGLKVGPAKAKPYGLFYLGDVFPECHFADGRYRLKGENPNDLVAEWVEPVLTIEEGKYYTNRTGEKQGPFTRSERKNKDEWPWLDTDGFEYRDDGSFGPIKGEASKYDLVAECVDPVLTIEEGKYYRARSGDVSMVGDDWDTARYTKGGVIYRLDSPTRQDMPGDLVEEAPAPATTGPVIEVTRSQIVPGVYDGVRVSNAPAKGFVSVYLSNGSASADELEAAAKVLTELAKAVRNA